MRNWKQMISAVALAVASSASAQDVTIGNVNPDEIVNLVVTPGASSVPAFNGGVYAGICNFTYNSAPLSGFCIDVAHDVYSGESFTDYTATTLTSSPEGSAGPMNTTQATDIEKLWAAYYPSATGSPVMAAALQVAIWETLGNGNLGYTVTESDGIGVGTEAAVMLSSLGGLTTEQNLEAYTSSNGQSFIVDPPVVPLVIAVPEPTTLIAGSLLLLPFMASALRILGKRQAA